MPRQAGNISTRTPSTMTDINTPNGKERVGTVSSSSAIEDRQALFAALDSFEYVVSADQIELCLE